MKSMTWILTGVLSLACAAISQAAAMNGDTENAVAALEQKWAQVQRENKTELEAPLLAEKFEAIGADGKISNRAQFMASEKATKYTTASLDDIHVTVFGDTAIARTLMTFKGTDPTGKPLDSHARWTDTWVKMGDGQWQCVAVHGSDVKK
jgi:ketosteroid isomerase-like protein